MSKQLQAKGKIKMAATKRGPEFYQSKNPIAYKHFEDSVQSLTSECELTRLAAKKHTIKGLEAWAKVLTGDDARRMEVTLAHLRRELRLVPVSLSMLDVRGNQ
jgi:hypothetical protein